MKTISLLATASLAALVIAGAARADDFMDAAKARVAAAIKRAGAWDGPTTGPTAAKDKTIIYVAGDLRNGGTSGVADGVKEAAAAIGWKLQVIDGQGQVSTRTAALNQAVALKPDGIIVSGFDAIEQNAALEPSRRRAFRSSVGTRRSSPARTRPRACSPTSTPASSTSPIRRRISRSSIWAARRVS